MTRHVPRRRCVGCGRIAPKVELLRIALAPEPIGGARATAVPDPGARLPGRGAYICRGAGRDVPAAECIARAVKRRAIARTLRAAVSLDPKLVESVGR